jgi:hypothetical protein
MHHFVEHEAWIDVSKARMIVLVSLFALPVVLMFAYQILWDKSLIDIHKLLVSSLTLIGAFVLGLVVHEAVHVAGFIVSGASPKSIGFLVDWKTLTAAVTCSECISARALKLTCLLPLVILGLVPGLMGLVSGSLPISVWSALMISAAAGDVAFFWAIRNVPGHCPAKLHGSKIGCRYYEYSD